MVESTLKTDWRRDEFDPPDLRLPEDERLNLKQKHVTTRGSLEAGLVRHRHFPDEDAQ